MTIRSQIRGACLALSLLGLIAGCTSETAGRAESEPPDFGKLDSFRAPTLHGALAFGESAEAAIGPEARFHAWDFELMETGTVEVLVGTQSDVLVDSVLYLYQQQPSGGFGRYIARSDVDDDGPPRILQTFGPGRYRALVKGYSDDVVGAFTISLSCVSGGCGAPFGFVEVCTLGGTSGTYAGLLQNGRLALRRSIDVTAATELTADEGYQVLSAIGERFEGNRPLPDALAQVDGGTVHLRDFIDLETTRLVRVIELVDEGASYGKIFGDESAASIARIRAGDIVDCDGSVIESQTTLGCDELSREVERVCGEDEDWASVGVGVSSCLEERYGDDAAARQAMTCCGSSTASYCSAFGTDTSLTVTRTDLPRALVAATFASSFTIQGDLGVGEDVPEAPRMRAYALAKAHVGSECDGVPAPRNTALVPLGADEMAEWMDGDVVELFQAANDERSAAGARAIAEHLRSRAADLVAYQGDLLSEVCGGTGSGSVNIVFDRGASTMLYFVIVEYAE